MPLGMHLQAKGVHSNSTVSIHKPRHQITQKNGKRRHLICYLAWPAAVHKEASTTRSKPPYIIFSWPVELPPNCCATRHVSFGTHKSLTVQSWCIAQTEGWLPMVKKPRCSIFGLSLSVEGHA